MKTKSSEKKTPVEPKAAKRTSSKSTASKQAASSKASAKPARRATSRRKAKKKPERTMPTWLSYVLAGVFALLFVFGFYYFCIRPYAYRWKPCYGFKAYGICMPSGYSVHGVDISHHQGKVDWKMLAQTRQARFPIRFVFMKASEGGDYSDKAFQANFDSARAHGFIRGAYHFYNPKTDPVRQADFFIRSVKLEAGDLPPVLDIEKKAKDENKLRSDLKIWLDRIEQHYKVKPILYTSYKFKTRYLNDSIFDSYLYWIAHYYVDSVEYQGDWKFWQHTDAGTLPGISEKVDLNIFNGSQEELEQMTLSSDRD